MMKQVSMTTLAFVTAAHEVFALRRREARVVG